MYVKVINGKATECTLIDFRNENSHISFPEAISTSTLARYNVFPLKFAQVPNYDKETQKLVKNSPELIDDQWTITWSVQDLDVNEVNKKKENRLKNLISGTNRPLYLLLVEIWQQLHPDLSISQAEIEVKNKLLDYTNNINNQ